MTVPAIAETADTPDFEIDREAHILRFVRDFAAPRELVFDAWTRPEEISCWWDAGGERLIECEMDVRPGGSFRFLAASHAHMAFTGTYIEVSPPERLVFTAMDATGRVTLAETARGTRMTVEIVCNSAEHLEDYIRRGVARGTSQTCDNLVAYIWEVS